MQTGEGRSVFDYQDAKENPREFPTDNCTTNYPFYCMNPGKNARIAQTRSARTMIPVSNDKAGLILTISR